MRSPGALARPELLGLFLLAVVTRFWAITTPGAVVFDEGLYEEYISHYFNGTYYFNLHPPVGKLILALGAWLLGVPAATLAAGEPAVILRAIPAAAGTLIIPVFHQLLLQLGAGRRVAALGAFLLLCDGALLSVSRLILIDSFLILFLLGALSAYLASRSRTGRARWAFVALAATLAGLAAGTKWTGLGALGVIAFDWVRRAAARGSGAQVTGVRDAVTRGWRGLAGIAPEAAATGAIAAAVYASAFAVHFALLPNSGTGDRAMSAAFTETLVGSPTYRPDARMSFPAKLADVHAAMRAENAKYVGADHTEASPWWSWPILKHAPYVYVGGGLTEDTVGRVFILGNLFLWWAVLIALAALAVTWRASWARLGAHQGAMVLLLAAYAINYLPFAFVSRILFLYSYLPAFAFSLAIALFGVGARMGWLDSGEAALRFPSRRSAALRFPSRRSAALYWGVAGFAFATFIYFAPFAYGSPLTEAAYQRRLWLLERHFFQS